VSFFRAGFKQIRWPAPIERLALVTDHVDSTHDCIPQARAGIVVGRCRSRRFATAQAFDGQRASGIFNQPGRNSTWPSNRHSERTSHGPFPRIGEIGRGRRSGLSSMSCGNRRRGRPTKDQLTTPSRSRCEALRKPRIKTRRLRARRPLDQIAAMLSWGPWTQDTPRYSQAAQPADHRMPVSEVSSGQQQPPCAKFAV